MCLWEWRGDDDDDDNDDDGDDMHLGFKLNGPNDLQNLYTYTGSRTESAISMWGVKLKLAS